MRYQPRSQIRITKFGQIWNESRPHGFLFAGVDAGGSGSTPRSGASHGPNRPLRVTISIGLSISGGIFQPLPAVGRDHAVRTVDLVVQTFEAGLLHVGHAR